MAMVFRDVPNHNDAGLSSLSVVPGSDQSAGGALLWVRRSLRGALDARLPTCIITAISLGLYAWVIVTAVLLGPSDPHSLWRDFIVFVVLAAIVEIPVLLVRSAAAFRVAAFIRLLLTVAAVHTIGFRSLTSVVFLSVPLLLETMEYDDGIARNLAVTLTVTTLAAAVVVPAAAHFSPASIAFAGSYVIWLLLVSVSCGLLALYREDIVERIRQVKTLETTVANLADANRAYQSYADNLETESAERERNRITGELHDTIGYALTNVIVMMNAGKILLEENPASVADVLERVGEQSDHALTEVRKTLHKMTAIQSPKPKGLQAVYGLVRAFQGATGITVELNRGNLPWTLGQRLDLVLYRLVQEGLTNAFRHGKATEVTVSFWRAQDEIRVAVRDNGIGIAMSAGEEGIGLTGIRNRLSEFGGTLATRNPGVGFELEARIPFRVGGIGEAH